MSVILNPTNLASLLSKELLMLVMTPTEVYSWALYKHFMARSTFCEALRCFRASAELSTRTSSHRRWFFARPFGQTNELRWLQPPAPSTFVFFALLHARLLCFYLRKDGALLNSSDVIRTRTWDRDIKEMSLKQFLLNPHTQNKIRLISSIWKSVILLQILFASKTPPFQDVQLSAANHESTFELFSPNI
jgi:hypothetical protein